MQKRDLLNLLGLSVVLVLSGCVVRTYPLTRDRVDQNLNTGNRGYLKGQSSTGTEVERKASRTTQIIEIELRSPIKFEKGKKANVAVPASEASLEEGNRGYLTQSDSAEIAESQSGMQQYTVGKNDTLQKISMKFYGTTKKWQKLYEANKDVLKGPDKVYPGQILNIPVEGMKTQEIPQNLK